MAGILGQINQNAQGLGNTAMQQQQMQQVERQNQMQDDAASYLQQYQQSVQAGKPDNSLLYSGVLKSPQLASSVLGAIGIVDKQQKTGAANDIVNGIAAAKAQDKKSIMQWGAKRIADIKARGGDPTDTQELVKNALSGDWDSVNNSLMTVGAALANEGYIRPELIGFGQQAEPMSAFQQASTDLRKQELEFNKAQKATETKLKVLEAQMRKEDNNLKREDLQLKIQEQQQKLADMAQQKTNTNREKEAELNQAYFSMDNMLNTVERIKKSPKLDSVVGTVQGRMDAYIDDDDAATIRLIDGLGSQAFMAMVPSLKGMGALSNAEGDKLAASLQNLSRVTSESAFRENLSEVERLIGKSRSFLSKKYGKPETAPDTPAARNEQDIFAEYGL